VESEVRAIRNESPTSRRVSRNRAYRKDPCGDCTAFGDLAERGRIRTESRHWEIGDNFGSIDKLVVLLFRSGSRLQLVVSITSA